MIKFQQMSQDDQCKIAFAWESYLFCGMTPEQVQNLGHESMVYWMDQTQNPDNCVNKNLPLPNDTFYDNNTRHKITQQRSYFGAMTISDEMKELYKALDDNGFDTWIVTANFTDTVKGACRDILDIPADHILGELDKIDANGKYINESDFDTHDFTLGEGKTTTIIDKIAPNYNKGLVLVGLDSFADYNFATEFHDTSINFKLY